MDKTYILNIQMQVCSLYVNKDIFRPPDDNEKVSYLSVIGALMYIANNTIPEIAFSVNLLAIYSFSPTKKYYNEIKHIYFVIFEEQLI